MQFLMWKLNDKAREITITVTAAGGNISTISTSKFYPSNVEQTEGVMITLPVRREIEVFFSGDLKEITGKINSKIVREVEDEVQEYFNLTR